jgi:hypothetical protein
MTCSCPHTNFAVTPERARELLAANPSVSGEILEMPEAIQRARDTFGQLLERDVQEATHADPDRA